MKLLFYLLVLSLVCTVCLAQQNPAVGKWNCTSDDGHGGVHDWTLTINETEGKLSGSIFEADTNMALINPRLDGKTLTFRTLVNPNCTILFEINIDGKKMEGRFSCPEVSGTMKGTRQS
jgi:hypothetical protein